MNLSTVDYALLGALEQFRLLTIAQGVRLGIANYSHVAERFRGLRTAKLVHRTERQFRMGEPMVFCLSPKGARELALWRGDAVAPAARKEAFGDTMHLHQRVLTVDLHITLLAWAHQVGAIVEWVRVEFDPNPEGLFPATTISRRGRKSGPDMLAAVRTADGSHWLLAFEVETGGRSHRLSNFTTHLEERLETLRTRHLEHGCDWPKASGYKAARLVFVFETADMLAAARKRVQGASGAEWRRVFLGALTENLEAFCTSWWSADGATGAFIPVTSIA